MIRQAEQALPFGHKFRAGVQDGSMRVTFRAGVRHVRVGEAVVFYNDDPESGWAISRNVTGTRACRFHDITAEDMVGSNYPDVEAFRHDLCEIYPYLSGESLVTMIRFE